LLCIVLIVLFLERKIHANALSAGHGRHATSVGVCVRRPSVWMSEAMCCSA
jgi:hypothetical protein